MLTNGTGIQSWPLSAAGGGDNPSLTQGSPTVFNLNTLPIAQGNLAYYLPALMVTITGILTQSGGTGVRTAWNNLYRILVESLELRNAWHGSPISPQFVKGSMMPVIEQVTLGYRNMVRKRGFFAAANGATSFSFSFPVPLSLGVGQKPHHTAQLVALYKEAQLSVQVAQASVLTALSPGATLSSLACRCSAILLPEAEIRLGPVMEIVDYQVAATSGQVNVPIQSFGNNTGLTRMERGAGLVYFGLLTSNQGLPGPFLPENITRLNVPWRGQTDTGHLPPYIAQQILAMGNGRTVGSVDDQAIAKGLSDTAGFPYTEAFDASNSTNELTNLLAVPLVTPGADFEVTKAQVVDGDESFNATLSSGPSGTWHNLAVQLKSWQPNAWHEAADYLISLGLPMKVLGQNSGLTWVPKTLRKNRSISAKKARFLPMVLKPAKEDTRPVTQGGTRLAL
jgi:hypothetical protein